MNTYTKHSATSLKNNTVQNETAPEHLPSDTFTGFFYPAPIWLDKHLKPTEKNLLVEIYLLSKLNSGCIASNGHFAKTLGVGKRSIERYIADLAKRGYLTIQGYGYTRQLWVNFDKLVPRKDGSDNKERQKCRKEEVAITKRQNCRSKAKTPHQTGEERQKCRSKELLERQKRQNTSPNCRHNVTTNKSTKNSISSLAIVSEKKEKNDEKKLKAKVKSKKTTLDQTAVTLPFASEAFGIAWAHWIKYRKEIRKPYKSAMSIQQILAKLAKFDEAFAIELIEKSIANGWQGLVFVRTGEQYEEWLGRKKQAITASNGNGTRACPRKNLLADTKEANSVYQQIRQLEANQTTFETYPLPMLQTIYGQLRELWRRATRLQMFDSEIQRIISLGNQVKGLVVVE